MMLTYTRTLAGDHAWKGPDGRLALWRGHASWYYRKDNIGADVHVGTPLCPLNWTDGDAITLYRAKVRIAESRLT